MSTLASSPHHTGPVTCFQIQVLAMPDQQSLSLPREYLKQHKNKFPNFCPRYGQCPCCKASSMFSRGSSFNFTGSNDVSLFCLLIISESVFMAFLINICAVKIKLLAKLQADVFYLSETWWCISSCQSTFPFAVLTSPMTLCFCQLWEERCFWPYSVWVVYQDTGCVITLYRMSYDYNSFYFHLLNLLS